MKTLKKGLCYRITELCCLLMALPALAGQPTQPVGNQEKTTLKTGSALTMEQVSSEPDLRPNPADLHWSPDGSRIAWMQFGMRFPVPRSRVAALEPVFEIWTLAAKPGAKPEILVDSQKMIHALRGSNEPLPPKINDDDDSNPWFLRNFAWSSDNAALYLFGNTSIARLNLATGDWKLLLSGKEPLTDAGLSPDGRFVSFLRAHSLCLIPTAGGEVRTLAVSHDPLVLEGEPDWSYRNLFHVEHSYAWSPDSKQIAWLETDDRAVRMNALLASSGEMHTIAYPKPGGAIPAVRLFVQTLASNKPIELHAGAAENRYLPRFHWLPDSHAIAIERLERSQQKLDLYRADVRTGESQILFTESDAYWININDGLHFLEDGSFLWLSERNGYRHLYHYGKDGKQIAQLTDGTWEITSLDAVDEKAGTVYFTATKASPLERQVYTLSLQGASIQPLTKTAGTHEVQFAPESSRFADIYSNRSTQPRLAILETKAAADEAASYQPFSNEKPLPALQPVEFAPFKLHMGQETASLMIKPKDFDPEKKYPVILYLAGGPGEQLVRDAWDGARGLWMQSMAEQGYLIFAIDNQGTAGRGHVFEEPIHLRLGAQEMVDERDAVNYLRSVPYVDLKRIGVCGWGYGGFLAVQAMQDRGAIYKAGFAGAPIVDWRTANAVFAERFLEDFKVRFHSWEASAAVSSDTGRLLKGRLMVAQGTEDEFVPLDQLFLLQGAMVDKGKSVETLLLPDRGHTIDDLPAWKLLFGRMTEFFLKNL
jgi:dipeptidyl-peptidase-4